MPKCRQSEQHGIVSRVEAKSVENESRRKKMVQSNNTHEEKKNEAGGEAIEWERGKKRYSQQNLPLTLTRSVSSLKYVHIVYTKSVLFFTMYFRVALAFSYSEYTTDSLERCCYC